MMKKRTWAIAAAGITAAIALLGWAFAPRPVEVEVATAVQGRFESTIDEDGKTRLRDRYVVSAPLAGLLSRIGLREGDRVEAGALVATMTPVLSPMLDARTLREQQLRVDITEAQLQRAETRIARAKVMLQQAHNDLRHSEQLARQGFVSANRLETDRLSAEAAQKDLDGAGEERQVAAHEVEQARAALMAVRRPERLVTGSFAVQAPIAGRVLRIVEGSETTVALGSPLIELGDTRSLEVVAELLTADALHALPGSPVSIERWGGAVPLQGRVRLVEPGAFTKVSALGVEEQRVKVLIDITSPPEAWQALGDGYRVGVRILTLAVDSALKVPASAVFPLADRDDGGQDRDAVFVLQEGQARLKPVSLGGRNGAEAWIRRGLAAGDKVIVYPPAAVTDGVRARARSVDPHGNPV